MCLNPSSPGWIPACPDRREFLKGSACCPFQCHCPRPWYLFLSQPQNMEIKSNALSQCGACDTQPGECPKFHELCETLSDYFFHAFFSAAFLHFPFTTFQSLSASFFPRDTHFYIKRYQKATKVSKDSGHSLGGRMNAEHGRVLFVGTFPDLQPA